MKFDRTFLIERVLRRPAVGVVAGITVFAAVMSGTVHADPSEDRADRHPIRRDIEQDDLLAAREQRWRRGYHEPTKPIEVARAGGERFESDGATPERLLIYLKANFKTELVKDLDSGT